MGTIIQLNPPQRPAAPPVAGEPRSPCEIVIFPGVRIERAETTYFDDDSGLQPGGGTDHGNRPRKSS